jgi:hypothetical protein
VSFDDVDWRILSGDPGPAYRQARNLTLGAHCGLLAAGVLVLTLTEGLAAAVPTALATLLCLSLLTGIALLVLRPTTRDVGRGVVAGTLSGFAVQVLAGGCLLFGWLSLNNG